jgi:hypothetical protein
VTRKIPPKTSKIIPNTPVTVPLKYKTAKIMANTTRMIRSRLPIFCFINTSKVKFRLVSLLTTLLHTVLDLFPLDAFDFERLLKLIHDLKIGVGFTISGIIMTIFINIDPKLCVVAYRIV